jgi:hypothetical protein
MISMLEQLGCLYGSGMLPPTGDRFTHAAQLRQLNSGEAANNHGQTISSEHIPATDAPIIETILEDPPSKAVIQLTASACFKPCTD